VAALSTMMAAAWRWQLGGDSLQLGGDSLAATAWWQQLAALWEECGAIRTNGATGDMSMATTRWRRRDGRRS
jgi:hypothetical protein